MDDTKSKSQKKRDADALQNLGNQLIALPLEDLESLPLTDNLYRAIRDAKSIKSHGAARRQSQLIGKLMRSADHPAITAAFEDMQASDKAQTAEFHATELWRERLLQEGTTALSEFIDMFRPEDIQQLRQLISKARTSTNPLQQKTATKALFRYLRSYI
ncbi:MAG: hypothetical protein CK424_06250 [Legionella sp.]|nr:MAG: hypothetical protein CK424_06250 [Legionella sp.]